MTNATTLFQRKHPFYGTTPYGSGALQSLHLVSGKNVFKCRIVKLIDFDNFSASL